MSRGDKREQINVWRPADLAGVEVRSGVAVTEPYPRHWHEEYQFCFIQAGGRRTAYARTTITSAEARAALLELGYSDDVTVFLNGGLVYSGVNGFESRHPEYLGFVKPEYENVSLKLRRGDNELVLAVTDDQRFGWGFIARLK